MNVQDWLTQARDRADAATPGPWRADDEHGLMPGASPAWCVSRTDESDAYLGDVAYTTGHREQVDALFIADARTRLPAALDAIQAVLRLANDIDPERHECGDGDLSCSACWADDIRAAIAIALGVSE